MKWINENLGELGGVLMTGFFIVLTIFGIYRGFHKSVGDGVASILIPPVAWYHGVAVIWEAPDWKKEYPERTANLAIALISTKPEKVDDQVGLSELLQHLHVWVKTLPKSEYAKLNGESESLCEAWIEFEEKECDAIINKKDLEDIKVEFHSNPQFEKEFNDSTKEANLEIKTTFSSPDYTNIAPEDMLIRYKAFIDLEKLDRKQRLDKIFYTSN